MRIAKANLEFKALNYNWNKHSLEFFNVLGGDFKNKLVKKIKNGTITDRATLKDEVVHYLKYNYWGRREYELSIGDLGCSMDDLEKMDVWSQLKPNLEHIIDHIIKELDLNY